MEKDIKIEDLNKLAAKGNAEAFLELARRYEQGDGVTKDEDKALDYVKKASDAGSLEGMYVYGRVCLDAEDEGKKQEGINLLIQAGNAGNSAAFYYLASYYEHIGNIDEAKELYSCAASMGSIDAKIEALQMSPLFENIFVRYVYDIWNKSNGSVDYAYILGNIYDAKYGDDIRRQMGADFLKSKGITLDISKNAELIINIAYNYRDGINVEKNLSYAFSLAEKSANLGNSDALCFLADCYQKGEGTEINMEKSISCLERAVSMDNTMAMHNLATLYRCGEGVPKDLTKMVELLTKAAEKGLGQSQHDLASAYFVGNGVEHDLGKAQYWYEKAEAQGIQHASKMLDVIKLMQNKDNTELPLESDDKKNSHFDKGLLKVLAFVIVFLFMFVLIFGSKIYSLMLLSIAVALALIAYNHIKGHEKRDRIIGTICGIIAVICSYGSYINYRHWNELEAYNELKQYPSDNTYNFFLQEFPHSKYYDEVLKSYYDYCEDISMTELAQFAEIYKDTRLGQIAKDRVPQICDSLYKVACKTNTIEGWRIYQSLVPESYYHDSAKKIKALINNRHSI